MVAYLGYTLRMRMLFRARRRRPPRSLLLWYRSPPYLSVMMLQATTTSLCYDAAFHHSCCHYYCYESVPSQSQPAFHRVTTCLENLQMSRNLTAVREMSGILLKVREVSGRSCLKLFIVSCLFVSIFDFAELVHFILVSDHALLHSYPHH